MTGWDDYPDQYGTANYDPLAGCGCILMAGLGGLVILAIVVVVLAVIWA